jgi:hypothetical protein
MSQNRACRIIDRETSGAIAFDCALEAYLDGGDPEDLLRAAGCDRLTIPLTPNTLVLAELTAAAASWRTTMTLPRGGRWFAVMWKPARAIDRNRSVCYGSAYLSGRPDRRRWQTRSGVLLPH